MMNSGKSIHKEEVKTTILCIVLGITIGLFPLWNIKFLLVILVGLLALTTLIVLRTSYDLIVFLNILLLSVVVFEPSPAELIFLLLLLVGVINGELNFVKVQQKIILFILLLSYILVNILGLFNTMYPILGIRYFLITFYLTILSVFFFLYSNEKRTVSILRAYVISTILSALLGFVGYMGYFPSVLMYDEYRIKALFKDPNVFGPFLIPSIIILIEDFKSRKILGNHIIPYIISIGLIALGTIFSFSRAAWINLALTVLVYFLLNIKKYSAKKIIILLIILFFCAYVIWFYILNDSLRSFFDSRSSLQNYDTGRFAAQRIGLSMAGDKIFGYGPGQYDVAISSKMGVEFSAHNLYIRLILENGIIGFLLFMTMFFYIMAKLFQIHIKTKGNIPTKSSVLFSILAGIMINSLVIDTLHWRHLWFFVGLSFSHIYEGSTIYSLKGGLYENTNHSKH